MGWWVFAYKDKADSEALVQSEVRSSDGPTASATCSYWSIGKIRCKLQPWKIGRCGWLDREETLLVGTPILVWNCQLALALLAVAFMDLKLLLLLPDVDARTWCEWVCKIGSEWGINESLFDPLGWSEFDMYSIWTEERPIQFRTRSLLIRGNQAHKSSRMFYSNVKIF